MTTPEQPSSISPLQRALDELEDFLAVERRDIADPEAKDALRGVLERLAEALIKKLDAERVIALTETEQDLRAHPSRGEARTDGEADRVRHPRMATPLSEDQLARALGSEVVDWCTSINETLFDQWCRYAGIEPNTYESGIAYGAFRAATEYFSGHLKPPSWPGEFRAAIARDVERGLTSSQIRDEIIAKVENRPVNTRMTSSGPRERHIYDAADRSRYCKWCNEEESHPVHIARPTAEVVYEAPREPAKAVASPSLQAAIERMDNGLNALGAEVDHTIRDDLRQRFEDVLRHCNNQLLKPSHELQSLRYFHDNITAWCRAVRAEVSGYKDLGDFCHRVLTNNGQALMKQPEPPIVTRRDDGAYTVGPPPGGKTVDERLAELTVPDWTAHNGRSNSSPLFLELIKRVAEIIRESAHSIVAGQLESVARSVMSSLAHEHNLIPRTLTRTGPLWLWRAWTDDNRLADSGWCAGASKEAAERQAWQIAGGPLHGLIKRIEITPIPEKA